MGSLAGLLKEAGHRVTGSDEGVYPPISTLLEQMGIPFSLTFDPTNLEPAPDIVVVGNAISRGNPELEAVLDQRLRYTSSASVLREEFLQGRHVLAVAGTHGKTTTGALLAWLLESAGLNPSLLVGGICENFGTSFRLTESDYFVIEADEYDTAYFDKGPKMWHYMPQTAVVTNVEFDHADIYPDADSYRFAFERFVNLIPGSGTLVVGWASPLARELSSLSFAPIESFGLEVPGDDGHPRWRVDGVEHTPQGTSFELVHDGERLGRLQTPLFGTFNIQNCLAAIAAAHGIGIRYERIRSSMPAFRSVRRRMEVKGEVRGVAVVDDFAHHPTAVHGIIQATRQRFPDRRIVTIFEPRSHTAQRREFQDRFRDALGTADRVILAGLFHPERFDERTGMDPEEVVSSLCAKGISADYIPEVDRIVDTVVPEASSGDVLLVLSNGGFGGIHQKLLDGLGA